MPLNVVAHYEPTATEISVTHLGQFPAVTVSFNLATGEALGDADKASQKDDGGDDGGHAAGGGDGRRVGDAPAIGHRHRRWADRQPDADALHDPGRVPLPRPPAIVV